MTRRRPGPEEALQRSIVQYMHVAVPDPPEGPFWTAINPMPTRSKLGGIMKAMGLRAGVPDMLLLWRGTPWLVELKAGKGPLSDAQKQAIVDIRAVGGVALTCRSLDEWIGILEDMEVPVNVIQPLAFGG